MKKTPSTYQPEQNLNPSLGLGDDRDRSKVTIHRIILRPVLRGNGKQHAIRSGVVYTASYLGEVIVRGSTQPALDAARVLHARGLTGRLEMWDEVSANYRYWIGITNGAGLTIEEGDRRPQHVQFKSFKSFNGRDTVEAISARPGINLAPKPNEPISTLRPAVTVQG